MSLENNDITAKNFQTFYEGIRPYLNGSFPTPIVNKFSKGDLYSTDEKIIGQWINGKPLYQKTVDSDSVAIPYNTWTNMYDVSAMGIDSLVNVLPYPFLEHCMWQVENGALKCLSTRNATQSASSFPITLQYTKTTDTPISIGEDTDYSTEEKIVGTWIDGKPLYQKTIEDTVPTCETSGTLVTKIINLDSAIRVKKTDALVVVPNGTNVCCFSSYYSSGTSSSEALIVYVGSTNNLTIKNGMANQNGRPIYITIQYTKTTD